MDCIPRIHCVQIEGMKIQSTSLPIIWVAGAWFWPVDIWENLRNRQEINRRSNPIALFFSSYPCVRWCIMDRGVMQWPIPSNPSHRFLGVHPTIGSYLDFYSHCCYYQIHSRKMIFMVESPYYMYHIILFGFNDVLNPNRMMLGPYDFDACLKLLKIPLKSHEIVFFLVKQSS